MPRQPERVKLLLLEEIRALRNTNLLFRQALGFGLEIYAKYVLPKKETAPRPAVGKYSIDEIQHCAEAILGQKTKNLINTNMILTSR